jgi:hypothetical protein
LVIKILAIGDTANIITELKKGLKETEIHVIDFPAKTKFKKIIPKDSEVFNSFNVFDHIKKINSIKKKYDLCLATGRDAARLAYLTDLNYIIYFAGSDIRFPAFIKNPDRKYMKNYPKKYNFIQRKMHKKIFDNAIGVVTSFEERYKVLQKYRKDAIRIDNLTFDDSIFNSTVTPIDLDKKKFVIFSPSRIGLDKGTDILWKALSYCKSDFELLQVDWVDKSTPDYLINKELRNNKPKQVKLIPLIDRNKIGSYYAACDLVFGTMMLDYPENVAYEGVYCHKPVISYSNPKTKFISEGKEFTSPFLPNSKDPKALANLIDSLVESKETCRKLYVEELEFVKKITKKEITAKVWDSFFLNYTKRYPSIEKNSNKIMVSLRPLYLILNKLIKKFY